MPKLRVYQLARELNRDNSEIIRELQHMGVPVTSHSNTVEDRLADQLRKKLGVFEPQAARPPVEAIEEEVMEATEVLAEPVVEPPVVVEAAKVEAPRVEAKVEPPKVEPPKPEPKVEVKVEPPKVEVKPVEQARVTAPPVKPSAPPPPAPPTPQAPPPPPARPLTTPSGGRVIPP